MKRLFLFTLLATLLCSLTGEPQYFTGKIVMKYDFKDTKGNDMTEKIAAFLGREQHYFIDSSNYKSMDENNNWMQLYNSSNNSFYMFTKDKSAQKLDGGTHTSQKAEVIKLDKKEKIAGYECSALQMETDDATTVYYYSPRLRVNPAAFAKHNYGDWNKYLEASGGALALKFVMTDHKNGYVWTSTAIGVIPMKLTAKDFEFPSDYKVR